MAVQTAATTLRENVGSLTLMMFSFTSIADSDTFDSGLGTNIVHSWVQGAGNPVTQASAGVNITRSGGVYTFFPGEDSLAANLFVLART